ncbi:hypothetical protein PV10_03008 [Exophiala mesophila]|uniref:Condensin complex subunit 2 n=1 Tax=Exophiala mesophila TaxID=212818 RepID=A0A0D1ZN01_EXOME|nr:uncharacterized protein PV10_03008 [Exophiala mesophila]KIV95339.1 hypothetical protein PV10_03008 [Exophiala mesophila]
MPRNPGQQTARPSRQAVVMNMAREKGRPSPVKLSLNDDRGEKAARLQSRQALQEIHMNEIRAAASPVRKINQRRDAHHRAMSESPRTPRTSAAADLRKRVVQSHNNNNNGQNSPRQIDIVTGHAATPPKRVPILANFEEWMKMATDNKINAANSWNFALIDYFHDMSLLKEGDGVNFQKASCTLDGCVKIYTSRVDSVATETGRLLSGLADGSANEGKKKRGDADGEDDDEDGEDGEEGEDGEGGKKKKKKPARSHEATLAPGFATFQAKKLDLEFAVDPLFKKASADFDEGGAKGLLLNHLSIDSDGRIVFDSSDDAGDAALAAEKGEHHDGAEEEVQDPLAKTSTTEAEVQVEEDADEDEEIDLDGLASKFFPDLSILDNQDVCPSMKTFTLGDPSGDLGIPFLKAPEDWRDQKKGSATPQAPPISANLSDQTGIFLDGSNALAFDDDDDDGGLLGGFDVAEDVGFGEGGEAWARDAAIDAQARVGHVGDLDDNLIEGNNADGYAMSLQHKYQEDAEHESVMAYFEKAFNSRAKGKTAFMTLDNWRMQKIQKAQQTETAPPTRQRKEKEPFEIDFVGPMSESLQELLAAPTVLNTQISLPKAQWRTKGRNLLDKDDEVIDPRKFMRLWTKPKCRIGRRKGALGIIDEGFGARNRVGTVNRGAEDEDDEEGRKGDYDANFFADDDQMLPFDGPLPIDDDDDDDGILAGGEEQQAFMDAREMLSPQPEGHQQMNLLGDAFDPANDPATQQPPDTQFPNTQQSELLPGSFGSQLVTQAGKRLRPEYVNYARTAKKVDVRRLKENMWKGMSVKLIQIFDKPSATSPTPVAATEANEDVDMMDVDDRQEVQTPVDGHEPSTPPTTTTSNGEVMNFTEMIQDLRQVYPEQQMKDISTSYCFICLLHLANEKGLVLEGEREGEDAMQEIRVFRDPNVGEGYEGE